KYHVDPGYLDPALRDRIVQDSLTLVRALGYDMNSIEWAVRGGIPYAIDFMNPAPDFDINALTPEYFDWAVRHMADLAIRLATRRPAAKRAFHWQALFKGRSKARPARSEEHTSELQSRFDLVCRLLLEKKKSR